MNSRRTIRLLAAAAIVSAFALACSGAAVAHHSVKAIYTGTAAGGGTIEFGVNAGGDYINYFEVSGVPTSCGTVNNPYGAADDKIIDHAFAHDWGSVRYSGTFGSRGHAQGVLSSYSIGGCKSDPVAWTATTATAPAACSDYADNDGDGRTDGADPGCTGLWDVDETDLDTGAVCPWRPDCPGFEDDPEPASDPRPVLSGLTVQRGGRRVAYRLSEPAEVVFKVARRVRGRYRAIRGERHDFGHRGSNSFRLGRRIGTTSLRRGRYRLTAVPKDGAGQRGAAVRVRFRIGR